MTVCNWNALHDCEFCSLSLEHLTRVNSETGFVENYTMEYDSKVVVQHEQPFQCLVFNNRSMNPVEAKDVGYSGTLTFYFKLPLVPQSLDGRFGLQISFHEIGTVPNVFSETNFAIPNVDNFFSVTKVLTTRLKPTKEDGLHSVRWESVLSFIELTDTHDDIIVISVAYASMNLRQISEIYTTSLKVVRANCWHGWNFVQVGPVCDDGVQDSEIRMEQVRQIQQIQQTLQERRKKKKKTWMYTKVSRAITCIGWFIATAMCIWYIVDSSEQFVQSISNPTTATTFIESVPLPFPAITVCNWNAMLDCDYCNLTLKFATKVNSTLGIVENLDPHYDRVVLFQNGQLFNCYVFNNVSQSLLNATDIGYAGTISFYFHVPFVPENRDSRFGLQVSFHETGTVPNVFAETNYAISGVDNYFILTKVITNRLKPNTEGGINSVRWHPQLSIVELTQFDGDEVVISVAYSTLNVNVITEMVTSTMEGLLGQIAGIIGIL
ncbi:predicted protein [Naegleria gruberi]|uniref:Predicted protein n=1 Tax=Naegleria gruberi TaxID=5762 RepID=D2V6U6_NAEGR|nr:uncharacterized protein NAEGRDRAFT_64560 [Naegleria gruberi]EFC47634.1 predicted protein [Naegleria gruberi]|eukprot:XP_002680378.1 predicted protein [Naegleria gruberi strain NEG-M]